VIKRNTTDRLVAYLIKKLEVWKLRRKVLITIILGLMLSLVAVMPAMASEKLNLNVNGEAAGMFDIYGENGVTMIPVDAYLRIAGADLGWVSDKNFNINENGASLALVVGQKEASLNGNTVTMPAGPVSVSDQVYVPLRFVAGAFGFDVTWDEKQRLILMERSETRDGLTPLEVVVKSGAATQDINNYSMDGNMNVVINMEADGVKVTAEPMKMDMQLKGQIQNEPMQIYMQQLITAATETGMPETAVETYMTTDKMYIKMPEQGWIAQDMPFSPDFWQQQQDIQSNPIQAAEQMKEMGMFMNFGNDVTVGEQDYYVVNATLDMEKFREALPQMMQQVVQGVSGTGDAQNPELNQVMQQMLESMDMEYFYTVLINKDTLITDVINLDARIKMDVEAGTVGDGEQQEPKVLKIDMNMSGEIKITDPGMPFNAPDVSDAKAMTELE